MAAAALSQDDDPKTKAIHDVVAQTFAPDQDEAERDAEQPGSTDGAKSPPIPSRRFYPSLLPRPNCTHIVMDYLYTTDIRCDTCGLPPRLGWLFVCQQDGYSEAVARRQMDMLNQIEGRDQLPSRIDELQACGMSRSILEQIKQGNVFDQFQIEVLKNQKINMLRVMDKQLSKEHEPWNMSGSQINEVITSTQAPEESPLSSNVTLRAARNATTKIVQKLGHFRRRSQAIPKCGFKCCYACRPYLRDRAYVSLSAAVVDDIEPERFIPQELPISDRATVETLGLKPVYISRFRTVYDSSDEHSTSTSDTNSVDEDASEYEMPSTSSPGTPAQFTRHNSVGQSLEDETSGASESENTQKDAGQPVVEQTSHPLSPEHKALSAAGTTNDTEENSDGLFGRLTRSMTPKWLPRRSRSSISLVQDIHLQPLRHAGSHQALSSRAKCSQMHPESADLGLQTPITSVTAHNLPGSGLGQVRQYSPERYYANLPSNPSSGQASPRSDVSLASASSEEIAVEGGVALTEEAVETKIPDIITQV